MENATINKKSIYSFNNKVVKKPTTHNLSITDKLEILKDQLIEYKKQYELELLKSKLNNYNSTGISEEWVDETLRYYEYNFGDDLDSIIAYFEHKLKTSKVSKQKTMKIQNSFICN